MTKTDFYAATHTGKREHNEDSYVSLPEHGVWAIADGMGGHGGGDVASQTAIEEIERQIKQGASLTEAISTAHKAIQAAALNGLGNKNMGSTVVALKLEGLHYEIDWVGDSRAYLFNGTLSQLSTDHSYVQGLVNVGIISSEEALTYPGRNIITQALGVGGTDNGTINIEQVTGELKPGDSILLCSDGLSGAISGQDIAAILSGNTDNSSKVGCLIEAALVAGGKDNVTVVLVTAG